MSHLGRRSAERREEPLVGMFSSQSSHRDPWDENKRSPWNNLGITTAAQREVLFQDDLDFQHLPGSTNRNATSPANRSAFDETTREPISTQLTSHRRSEKQIAGAPAMPRIVRTNYRGASVGPPSDEPQMTPKTPGAPDILTTRLTTTPDNHPDTYLLAHTSGKNILQWRCNCLQLLIPTWWLHVLK